MRQIEKKKNKEKLLNYFTIITRQIPVMLRKKTNWDMNFSNVVNFCGSALKHIFISLERAKCLPARSKKNPDTKCIFLIFNLDMTLTKPL